MKVLYFDVPSFLYSKQYIDSDQKLARDYDDNWFKCGSDFLRAVTPDKRAIDLLSSLIKANGYKLYPISYKCTRANLLEFGLFDESQLAPEIDWVGKTHIDDADPLRRMVAHADAVNAEDWRVIGNYSIDGVLINRHIKSESGKGLTFELAEALRNLC